MKRYNEQQAIEICGRELVEKVLSENVEPTSRVMYPAFEPNEHIGKTEYSNCVFDDKYKLAVYYYLTKEEEENMDSFDWDNPEFEIEEL